jgi:hypothetical protein
MLQDQHIFGGAAKPFSAKGSGLGISSADASTFPSKPRAFLQNSALSLGTVLCGFSSGSQNESHAGPPQETAGRGQEKSCQKNFIFGVDGTPLDTPTCAGWMQCHNI